VINSSVKHFFRAASSLTVTFALIVSFFLFTLLAYNTNQAFSEWLIVPSFLLVVNLCLAIYFNKKFQANLPLLLFHLGLLFTLLLIALSRLTYLNGQLELNEGQVFDGNIKVTSAGLLHDYNLEKDLFASKGIELSLTPKVAITAVRSRISTNDGAEIVIGEHKPLVINHYRFYVTRNVGYSALFTWRPFKQAKTPQDNALGTVHFPPFLFNQFSQTAEWTIPGTNRMLWMMLSPNEDILQEAKPIKLSTPKNHHLVIRDGERRIELSQGQEFMVEEGVLTYVGLRTWMGYKVHYEPFKAYLLAVLLLTIIFLSWFFYRKFSASSWLD